MGPLSHIVSSIALSLFEALKWIQIDASTGNEEPGGGRGGVGFLMCKMKRC